MANASQLVYDLKMANPDQSSNKKVQELQQHERISNFIEFVTIHFERRILIHTWRKLDGSSGKIK